MAINWNNHAYELKECHFQTFKLCTYCIQGIKSHGERVFVGDIIDGEGACEWCEEEDDTLFGCHF